MSHTALSQTTVAEVPTVPCADEMDNDTFLKHYNKRHLQDSSMSRVIERDMAWEKLAGMWRAFHRRCHNLAVPGQYDHEHEGDWE